MGNLPPPTHINIFREVGNYWTSRILDKNINLDFPISLIFSLLFLSLFFVRSFSQIQNSLQQVTNMGHLTSIGEPMSKGNNLQHSNVNPPQKAIELFTFYLNTLWIGTSKSLFLFLESRLRRKENNSRQSKIWYWKKTVGYQTQMEGQAWRKFG